jgi:hypothetical protein
MYEQLSFCFICRVNLVSCRVQLPYRYTKSCTFSLHRTNDTPHKPYVEHVQLYQQSQAASTSLPLGLRRVGWPRVIKVAGWVCDGRRVGSWLIGSWGVLGCQENREFGPPACSLSRPALVLIDFSSIVSSSLILSFGSHVATTLRVTQLLNMEGLLLLSDLPTLAANPRSRLCVLVRSGYGAFWKKEKTKQMRRCIPENDLARGPYIGIYPARCHDCSPAFLLGKRTARRRRSVTDYSGIRNPLLVRSGPRNRAPATRTRSLGDRTVRGTEGPHLGRGKREASDRNVWPLTRCTVRWNRVEGWRRVQHQLEHGTLSHLVVVTRWLELRDGHGV